MSGRARIEASSGVRVRARDEWRARVRVRASDEKKQRESVSVRASDEKNQRSSVRSRSHSHSDFVPYGLDLSNFIDDFQALRILMNNCPAIKRII